MADYIVPIRRLIEEFRKLPGVGAKTATRYAFSVLSLTEEEADAFADGVWVEFGHADCRFSRNGFALTGEPVSLVLSRVEGTPTLEDLTILCLNDTM